MKLSTWFYSLLLFPGLDYARQSTLTPPILEVGNVNRSQPKTKKF